MRIKDLCAFNNFWNRRWIYARAQNWSSVEYCSGKFWDTYTQGPDILEFHLGSRSWGHHHTSSAHPPRCLVRCEWNFPRSFITSRRSASRALKRFSSRSLAVFQPFLSRSWAENGGKFGFWAAVRPFLALHDLKPILARCKPIENGVKAPCRGSSAIVVVVRR
jgi:hypothetical protein